MKGPKNFLLISELIPPPDSYRGEGGRGDVLKGAKKRDSRAKTKSYEFKKTKDKRQKDK